MGTIAHLCVDDYPLIDTKNELDPLVLTIFRESDRRVYKRKMRDRSPLIYTPDPDREEEEEEVIDYATTVAWASRRLDIMGFTMDRCRAEYERTRSALIDEVRSDLDDDDDVSEKSEWFDEYERRRLAELNSVHFDAYVEGLREILASRLRPDPFDDGKAPGLSDVVKYMLEVDEDWWYFRFFSKDPRCFLRVAFSVCAEESLVTQEISDLADSGWIDGSQPLCEQAITALLATFPENAPRIVLTEGSTDTAILRKALAILFPQLVGYYTFFDFEGSRAAGGAAQLVSVVKAFAAARISNRVIAIFDNDTAAHEAVRALRSVELPKNIVVLHYPEIATLSRYPTLGPAGEAFLDVNGTAASIELYLGRDVLERSGQLAPVQWGGHSAAMKRFQGAVVDKEQLQEAWHRKAAECQGDSSKIVAENWVELRAIWESVFHAFDASL